ncbi:MAG: hypothetical protein GXO10_04830 [Crenarchaeota archaeon]|nr:hypothetical protein [Thermoproteota archaeon]
MTLRKTTFGIGTAVAVIIIAILLLQYNVLRTGIPWIEKRPKIIVLRPEGYHAHLIEPGVVYHIYAPHSFVLTGSNINVLENGLEIWLNVTKLTTIHGQIAPAFYMAPGNISLEIDKLGHYVIIYRPINRETYYLSLLINGTYNCTVIYHKGDTIHIVVCNLPYKRVDNELYIYKPGTKNMSHCITIVKGNISTTICGIYNPNQIAEIDGGVLGYTIFGPEFWGNVTFKFRIIS